MKLTICVQVDIHRSVHLEVEREESTDPRGMELTASERDEAIEAARSGDSDYDGASIIWVSTVR